MNRYSRGRYMQGGVVEDCFDSDRSNISLENLNLREPQAFDKGDSATRGQNSGRNSARINSENVTSKFRDLARSSPRIFSSRDRGLIQQRHQYQEISLPKGDYPRSGCNSPKRQTSPKKHFCESARCERPREPASRNYALETFDEKDEHREENIERKKTHVFHTTPSGNLKVGPEQVVFNSKRVSIVVAEPNSIKINVAKELEKSKLNNIMPPIPSKLFQAPQGILKLDEKCHHKKDMVAEYDTDVDSIESLKPEMNLDRLGYSNNGYIDYNILTLPQKTNLYSELHRRISNYLNTDVQVIIGQEEFSCHSMVLQSYSEFFEKHVGVKSVELPLNEVSVNAFVIIYDWMITGQDCIRLLKRDNIIDVFIASRYLGIKELEEQCWAFIDSEEVFSEDTAFLLYKEAKRRGIFAVKDLMIPRIRNFFLILVSSQDFVELDHDEIVLLLSSNYIAVNCEMEVLMSAVRWLKYDWDNRLQYLVKVISCIRFGLIAPWQLVDIKRNPENPELLEIMTVPEVSKMVDDGLSFVIIKYWYGHQSDDYTHWIELLGLTEPTERNWAGSEKSYVTYRQFLAFLDNYRRDNLLEKTRLQTTKKDPENIALEPCLPPQELLFTSSNNSSHRNFDYSIHLAHDLQNETKKRASSENMYLTEDSGPSRYHKYVYRKSQSDMNVNHVGCGDRGDKLEIKANKKHSFVRDRLGFGTKNHKILSMFVPSRGHLEKGDNRMKVPATSLGEKMQVNSPPIVPSTPHSTHYQAVSCPIKENVLKEGSLFSVDRECVLVFGGIDPHSPYGMNRNTGNNIYRYLPEDNRWDYVGELPESRHHHSTAFYRGRIFLAGGANPSCADEKGDCAVNSVWSFDPIVRSWYRECPMITARKNFGFVVFDKKLYAIGGQDKAGRMLSSVERFEMGGTWSEVAPLQTARMGLACAKYLDAIWVAGGMVASRKYPLCSYVECYDSRRNEWERMQECLRIPRCCACLFSMNDKLYLIGGAGKMLDSDRTTSSVGAIDIWDPIDKQWKLQTELLIPRHGHSVAYLGTQILIIGGVTTVYMRALSNTECYCCERLTWVRGLSPLPTTLSGHSSVTLPPASLL